MSAGCEHMVVGSCKLGQGLLALDALTSFVSGIPCMGRCSYKTNSPTHGDICTSPSGFSMRVADMLTTRASLESEPPTRKGARRVRAKRRRPR